MYTLQEKEECNNKCIKCLAQTRVDSIIKIAKSFIRPENYETHEQYKVALANKIYGYHLKLLKIARYE